MSEQVEREVSHISHQDQQNFTCVSSPARIKDFDLCEATQRGLEAGIYSRGILQPKNENGVSVETIKLLNVSLTRSFLQSVLPRPRNGVRGGT